MKFPLGAMSVGDILDRGLKLLFARLPVFYVINLIVLTPVMLLQIALPFLAQGDETATTIIVMVVGVLLAFVLTIVLQPIGAAAILHIVMEEFAGRRVSMGQAFGFALTRFLSLLGTSLLAGLIVGGSCLLFCIPGIYFYALYAFVGQIVVAERLGGSDALSRSKNLVEGHWWRVFGVIVLVYMAGSTVSGMLGVGLSVVMPTHQVVPTARGVEMKVNLLNNTLTVVINSLVSIVFSTYTVVCTTLLYLDLRIRKEGFDLELAAGTADAPAEDRYGDRRGDRYGDRREDRREDRYEDDQW